MHGVENSRSFGGLIALSTPTREGASSLAPLLTDQLWWLFGRSPMRHSEEGVVHVRSRHRPLPGFKVPAIVCPDARLLARQRSRLASFPAGSSVFLALLLALIAISADQIASPIFRTTSPLLATLALLLFVWRRGPSPLWDASVTRERSLSVWRLAGFFASHLALIYLSRSLAPVAQSFSGSATFSGTVVGLGKLAILAPTLLLLPLHSWKRLVRAYRPEAIVAILVLTINVPARFVDLLPIFRAQVYMKSAGVGRRKHVEEEV